MKVVFKELGDSPHPAETPKLCRNRKVGKLTTSKYPEQENMVSTKETAFISQVLNSPPSQLTENLASEIHETNRFPDPYIFLVQNDGIYTPNGQRVEDAIDTASYLGKLEKHAFRKIQTWSQKNQNGSVVWFSPPSPENNYFKSKFIISKLFTSVEGVKVLFNRNLVLDIEADELMDLANRLAGEQLFSDPEILRAAPLFPQPRQLLSWFAELSPFTSQIEMVNQGLDLDLKTDTYVQVNDIANSIPIAGSRNVYATAYRKATGAGLIGKHKGSCPAIDNSPKTAFETFLEHSQNISEGKLKCTCPACKKIVTAEIRNGIITCPKCHASAPYQC